MVLEDHSAVVLLLYGRLSLFKAAGREHGDGGVVSRVLASTTAMLSTSGAQGWGLDRAGSPAGRGYPGLGLPLYYPETKQ